MCRVQKNTKTRINPFFVSLFFSRFQHPRPIKPWTGVKNVTGKPNSCIQISGISFPGHPGIHFVRKTVNQEYGRGDTGYRIQDTRFKIEDTGYSIKDTKKRIHDTGYRIQDAK